MSRRTDRYSLKASPELLARMATPDQVHPPQAREALAHGLLVFGLCPDMKWRRVEIVSVHKAGPTAPTYYRIVFASFAGHPCYVRTFTKDGILLVEAPQTTPVDLTGD